LPLPFFADHGNGLSGLQPGNPHPEQGGIRIDLYEPHVFESVNWPEIGSAFGHGVLA